MKKILTLTLILPLLFSCNPNREREGVVNPGEINERLNDISNYPTVVINGQIWLSKNLAVSNFRNGDSIFYAATLDDWIYAADHNIPAWTFFNFWEPIDEDFYEIRFYNWHAVNDTRGLAPKGWRVPSLDDWDELLKHYIINEEKTRELKSEENWDIDGRGNNASGFNAKAFGHCDAIAGFANDGISTGWWTSNEYNSEEAWYITLNKYDNLGKFEWEKGSGMSIRLVKD